MLGRSDVSSIHASMNLENLSTVFNHYGDQETNFSTMLPIAMVYCEDFLISMFYCSLAVLPGEIPVLSLLLAVPIMEWYSNCA
jgi:hypothetical protein